MPSQKKEKAVKIPSERVEETILLIRGQKVILDVDLAELYGVPTKALKQAVRRNKDRFPKDFMFELTKDEITNLRSQFVTSSLVQQWGGTRYKPMAFTEQGVAMLSSVLRSKRAAQVNIEIMRAFVRLRQMLSAHKDMERKIADLEKKYDEQFGVVFEAIRQLMAPPDKRQRKIGFEVKESKSRYSKKKKAK
ncbi:MAG: ORF6N domain-containing protein [Deltaproteobacteria bacterium]|nr:ORF6N domain-containing protein [Deltaproteobacteria bacterium]MBW1943696.1 ORF6N domain-containing protein [Deltaproteobacteria bacterium]